MFPGVTLPSPQATCCFGPSRPQTALPTLDTVGRTWVSKPSVLSLETCLTVIFIPCKCHRCLNSCTLPAWIWHTHQNCGERHRHRGFDQLPTRQDCCCDPKAVLHFPASSTYCPCHMQTYSSVHCPASFCPSRVPGKNGKQVSSTTDAQNALPLISSSQPALLTPASTFRTHFSKSNTIC